MHCNSVYSLDSLSKSSSKAVIPSLNSFPINSNIVSNNGNNFSNHHLHHPHQQRHQHHHHHSFDPPDCSWSCASPSSSQAASSSSPSSSSSKPKSSATIISQTSNCKFSRIELQGTPGSRSKGQQSESAPLEITRPKARFPSIVQRKKLLRSESTKKDHPDSLGGVKQVKRGDKPRSKVGLAKNHASGLGSKMILASYPAQGRVKPVGRSSLDVSRSYLPCSTPDVVGFAQNFPPKSLLGQASYYGSQEFHKGEGMLLEAGESGPASERLRQMAARYQNQPPGPDDYYPDYQEAVTEPSGFSFQMPFVPDAKTPCPSYDLPSPIPFSPHPDPKQFPLAAVYSSAPPSVDPTTAVPHPQPPHRSLKTSTPLCSAAASLKVPPSQNFHVRNYYQHASNDYHCNNNGNINNVGGNINNNNNNSNNNRSANFSDPVLLPPNSSSSSSSSSSFPPRQNPCTSVGIDLGCNLSTSESRNIDSNNSINDNDDNDDDEDSSNININNNINNNINSNINNNNLGSNERRYNDFTAEHSRKDDHHRHHHHHHPSLQHSLHPAPLPPPPPPPLPLPVPLPLLPHSQLHHQLQPPPSHHHHQLDHHHHQQSQHTHPHQHHRHHHHHHHHNDEVYSPWSTSDFYYQCNLNQGWSADVQGHEQLPLQNGSTRSLEPPPEVAVYSASPGQDFASVTFSSPGTTSACSSSQQAPIPGQFDKKFHQQQQQQQQQQQLGHIVDVPDRVNSVASYPPGDPSWSLGAQSPFPFWHQPYGLMPSSSSSSSTSSSSQVGYGEEFVAQSSLLPQQQQLQLHQHQHRHQRAAAASSLLETCTKSDVKPPPPPYLSPKSKRKVCAVVNPSVVSRPDRNDDISTIAEDKREQGPIKPHRRQEEAIQEEGDDGAGILSGSVSFGSDCFQESFPASLFQHGPSKLSKV